jgi:hypothetical protein
MVGSFVQTIWRDTLTVNLIADLRLNERQVQAIDIIRHERRIVPSRYQEATGAGRPTAKRDLDGQTRASLDGAPRRETPRHPSPSAVLIAPRRRAAPASTFR